MICTASRLQGMQQFDTTYGRARPEMDRGAVSCGVLRISCDCFDRTALGLAEQFVQLCVRQDSLQALVAHFLLPFLKRGFTAARCSDFAGFQVEPSGATSVTDLSRKRVEIVRPGRDCKSMSREDGVRRLRLLLLLRVGRPEIECLRVSLRGTLDHK
jgi:hypothetical protein